MLHRLETFEILGGTYAILQLGLRTIIFNLATSQSMQLWGYHNYVRGLLSPQSQ
jgi:hypothetical protein